MKTIFIKLFCLILTLIWIIPSKGQVVTKEEATKIAQNWIHIVIDSYGTWGNSENANILSVRTLTKDGRKLGYFCNVTPKGFILVSIRKELAPVKLYSAQVNYNYLSDEDDCLPDFIYYIPAKVINTIEDELDPIESVSSAELKEILEIDYSESWDNIYNYIPGTYNVKLKGSSSKDGYQEGEFLLTSNWHQDFPYNNECPEMNPPCTTTLNGRALVGCVAITGGQIMNYWDWPPYGEWPWNDNYDWPNILDTVRPTSSQPEIDAVAKLCADIGEAVDMAYGCEESSAFLQCPFTPPICDPAHDLDSRLMNTFHFAPSVTMLRRGDYGTTDWFNIIKVQINASRPIAYQIRIDLLYGGHAVVVDGWQEIGSIKQYHINFGWGGALYSDTCWTGVTNSNTWYTLDAIPCFYDDFMLVDIVPANPVGTLILGEYTQQPSFPYRYFDRDAQGHDAVFSEGQNLQFFQEITVTGNSSSDHPVRFYGLPSFDLNLFTRGDLSNGIQLHDGEIKLMNFGSIKLH